jgi:PKD repeat protein
VRLQLTLLTTLMLTATGGPAVAQTFCDGPPSLTVLTGESITVSGLESEGHPSAYSWFVTPPGAPVPNEPTSTTPIHPFSPDEPGLWSIGLVTEYQHSAPLGGLWSSDDCVTVLAASVVASIGLAGNQVATDEDLQIDGFESQWAAGVTPLVEWRVDGLALGSCNGGPSPSNPGELSCTIPGNWLSPGWHTAALLLTDASSGQSSLSTADFEVIEIVPLTVDFDWNPVEPDPGQPVHFIATVSPQTSESDFIRVTWDLGDGTVVVFETCPQPWASCLEWIPFYATDGWYDVSVTVEAIDETASQTHTVKIGDPVAPPTASFAPTPSAPLIRQTTTLSFDGSCDGDCLWSWDFGDGGESTTENPSHSWEVPDTYWVTLTVSNQGGSDTVTIGVDVDTCWPPGSTNQDGTCYGGAVDLTAAPGVSWFWNTGETAQTIAAPGGGAYWVNIDDGTGCWGHSPTVVVLSNCGDETGDTNLDGTTDATDLSALIPELTDGDGDSVVGAGGGDLTAPGGDVTGDFRLRTDDLLTVLVELFD